MPACLEWAEERIEECNEWRDEGHDECSDWEEDCCDWWPCSWACEVVSWVCVAFVWIANWVCVGWTVITTAVCVVWDLVTTIVNAILVTLESIFGWLLSAIAFIIELLEMIPILGTLIRWIINIVTFIIWTVVGLADALLGLIGIRPEKKLRVCTVILRDERGAPVATVPYAVDLLQVAADIYKRDANVRLVPLAPFQYDSGFAAGETVDASWVTTEAGNSDSDTLDLPCGGGGAGAEWTLPGSKMQWKVSTNCFFGAWRRITGYGAPVACFVIRSIPGAFGCCLWITDYMTVINQVSVGGALINRRVLAHEAGHACNLWHIGAPNNPTNLMGTPWSPAVPDLTQTRLTDWQVLLVRASKHVTYF
jgi:hypothetical protein